MSADVIRSDGVAHPVSPIAPGRVAVVTGAASGIGLGLAERFAAEGMSVVMADVEEPALAKAAAGVAARAAEARSATAKDDVAKDGAAQDGVAVLPVVGAVSMTLL